MNRTVRNISVLLLGAAFVAGCGNGGQETEEEYAPKVTNVEIFTVSPTRFEDYISLPVVVTPNREVQVALTNGGRVTGLNADKGDRVTAGKTLLETDDVLLRAQLDQAEANLEYQEKEFARAEKLHADGSITEAAFDAARLQLATARSSRDMAAKNLDDATLEAPFAGVVIQRHVELGALLGPGTPAFTIMDIATAKVQAGIPEKYIPLFTTGNDVEIRLDALPGRVFNGRINYISPAASPGVRTFLAEMEVPNRDGAIKAGMMGNASILRTVYDDAVVIPLNAVVESQAGRSVFVARGDNTAEERTVTIGATGDDTMTIESGLAVGDKVIVKGQYDLVTGEKISITGEMTQADMEVEQ